MFYEFQSIKSFFFPLLFDDPVTSPDPQPQPRQTVRDRGESYMNTFIMTFNP